MGRQRRFLDQLSRNPATTSGQLEPVASLITESCARLLDVERVGLWLFNDAETELRCVDQFNLSTGAHSSGAVIHQDEFRSEFQALKDSLYVDASDPYTDPRTAGYVEHYLRPNNITSMLDVVIRFGGSNLGTLCFEHVGKLHTWKQHEIDFGCLVGAQLSVLMERRELRRTERARREIQERLTATQELDALKSQFLANISHEFRTPLTLLLGPVEDLLTSPHDMPTPWQREQLETTRRAALRLLRHVDALLDFVRAESGRVHATFEPTDLVMLTREVVGLFESAVTRAGLRLQFEAGALTEPAYVDRELWEKIVLNLFSNALKYTPQGEIAVALRQTSDCFELVVRDTGIGIPAEALPHIFERFYRVPSTGGRSVEGTGIGLATVKELVELHGGGVHVESTLGAGSTFRVHIPTGSAHLPADRVQKEPRPATTRTAPPWLAETLEASGGPPPAPQPPAAAEAPRPGTRARILVADDNADMRAYFHRLLAERYDVEVVPDGVQALEAARARPPALILTDVMMPRLDGVGLLRQLRADPTTRDVPVVMVSARAGEEAAVEGLSAGADDYLPKPFSARELLARVATHLDLARARRAATEAAIKESFLDIAVHELRTPLTSIKLRTQVAQQYLESGKGAAAARHLSTVSRSIDRLERLASDLLSVSAIQSGMLSLQKERCDLVALCQAAAEEESLVQERPVNLLLPPSPVELVVDPERIRDVIRHLLSNALKYSPHDKPVTLTLRELEKEALISVHDDGPGIPPDEVPHIFERYHRVPGIDVQVGSRVGLGVGLFVAKALVDQHGGRITVDTAVGRGSTFNVWLPR
ncbi:MAG: GAF domain-containing sensor histidine kinase [Myxococcota bacterium]